MCWLVCRCGLAWFGAVRHGVRICAHGMSWQINVMKMGREETGITKFDNISACFRFLCSLTLVSRLCALRQNHCHIGALYGIIYAGREVQADFDNIMANRCFDSNPNGMRILSFLKYQNNQKWSNNTHTHTQQYGMTWYTCRRIYLCRCDNLHRRT